MHAFAMLGSLYSVSCQEIAARFVYFVLTGSLLQCFDAVGWAAGRASGL